MQPCEVEREESHDILDAAGRPIARELGEGAIRFSTRPALGGRAAVVEIVAHSDGGAQVRSFALEGHPREGWNETKRTTFPLTPAKFGAIAAIIDEALASYRLPVPNPENGETIICTDGPGYLTERVREGRVVTLAGSCPPVWGVEHANVGVACALRKLLRQHMAKMDRPYLIAGRRCGGR